MDKDELLYTADNSVARITINREKERNSLTPGGIELFLKYLDDAERDASARALMITGAGTRAFCSGASLGTDMNSGTRDNFRNYSQLIRRIYTFPKPTVAKINGTCLAGGIGIMLACDIAIAGHEALFGTPEVNVGLWPMMIGALIYRNVPRKKAMKMVLLGRTVTAEEAVDMGLITETVPGEMLHEAAEEILGILISKSPIGIRIGKEAFCRMEDMALGDALDFLSEKIIEVASTGDAAEGIRAFLEKRKPGFTGK